MSVILIETTFRCHIFSASIRKRALGKQHCKFNSKLPLREARQSVPMLRATRWGLRHQPSFGADALVRAQILTEMR